MASEMVDCCDLPRPRQPDAVAQLTPVVRLPKFLSDEEVAAIQAYHGRIAASCGTLKKSTCAVTGDPTWETTYLSTDFLFQRAFPELVAKLLAAARRCDAAHFSSFGDGAVLRPRVVEYHEIGASGELRHAEHYDSGSVYTVDVMLAKPGIDFRGGDFVARGPLASLDADVDVDSGAFVDAGDVIVFCSHKHHSVRPVTSGTRKVLIIEFWEGEARACGHRCEKQRGDCRVRPLNTVLRESLADMTDEDAAAARRFLRGRTPLTY